MRGFGRLALTAGALMVALLLVTSAAAPETTTAAEVPIAITQPVDSLSQVFGGLPSVIPLLPESGSILLVGSGLLGLATIVRRSTRG